MTAALRATAPAAGGGAGLAAGAPAAGRPGAAPPDPRNDAAATATGRLDSFVPALMDPALAVPDGLVDRAGRPAGRRFDVYRNNVIVSLKAALAAGFPVIEKLVGPAFFSAMAGVFVRAHPPDSPVLARYGTEFPAFLASFEPVAHLPYLADVARLELALRAAYHAADARPIAPEALAHPRLVEARLVLAPATRVVASPYPIGSIWQANSDAGAPPARGGAEWVLVARPDWDPKPVVVHEVTGRFIRALLDGARFSGALEAAGDGLDLAGALSLLIATKSIIRIEVPT